MKTTKTTKSSANHANRANQKRVAIQLYGYLRSYGECRDRFFAHLVEPIKTAGYEVDIFMHSWDYIEGVKVSWQNESDIDDAIMPQTTPSKEYLTKLYNLKAISITPQPTHKDSDKFIKMRWENYRFGSILGAYYSQYSVNLLRQQHEKKMNIEYDLVLVMRPDLFFTNRFNLEWLSENLENKVFCYYWLVGGVFVWIDQFYLAKPCVVNTMTKMYEMLDYDNLCNGNFCDPEDAMQNFLAQNKIEVLCLGSKRPFEILRSKDYKAYRKIVEKQENEIVLITNKDFKELKKLEHLGGFLSFYTNKKISKIRRKTRKIRYPIKDFIKRVFDTK